MTERELPPIQVSYDLADLFGVQFHSFARFVRIFVIIELLWICLIVGVDAVDGVPLSWSIAHLPWKLLAWGALLIVAFWFLLCPFLAYSRVRRAGVGGPNTFALTGKGISVQTRKSESVVYWKAIRRTADNPRRLYLFLSSLGTLIVPRRSFVSDEEFSSWVVEAKRQVEQARKS